MRPVPVLVLVLQAPALEADTDLHFVTFVDHDGYLIELDGRRNSPINHGKIEKDLLKVRFNVGPGGGEKKKREAKTIRLMLTRARPPPPRTVLLQDTVKVVKRIMDLTQSIQFNLVALSPATEEDDE